MAFMEAQEDYDTSTLRLTAARSASELLSRFNALPELHRSRCRGQASYGRPICYEREVRLMDKVELADGLEPPTRCLQNSRSTN